MMTIVLILLALILLPLALRSLMMLGFWGILVLVGVLLIRSCMS